MWPLRRASGGTGHLQGGQVGGGDVGRVADHAGEAALQSGQRLQPAAQVQVHVRSVRHPLHVDRRPRRRRGAALHRMHLQEVVPDTLCLERNLAKMASNDGHGSAGHLAAALHRVHLPKEGPDALWLEWNSARMASNDGQLCTAAVLSTHHPKSFFPGCEARVVVCSAIQFCGGRHSICLHHLRVKRVSRFCGGICRARV